MTAWLFLAAVVVGTWNGNWFPSGRAEHRAHRAVEEATISAAAEMLRDGLDRMDPAGTNDVVLCLHEMRGPRVASNLVARIGRKGLRLVAISGYRRRDRFDMQQDAIATTLPVAETGWRPWTNRARETPPRGFAYAAVVIEPAVTARVCAVHLKSNYGGNTDDKRRLNRAKRTWSARDLVRETERWPVAILAGDFNTDPWRREFAGEETFPVVRAAGFDLLLALLPPGGRGTHPSARYGDSALDHLAVRGLSPVGLPQIVPNDALSDHFALFALVAPK